ncbi:hypothetical protein HY837_03515 [archaeon]|nr:hypothetical protein [archaeon]
MSLTNKIDLQGKSFEPAQKLKLCLAIGSATVFTSLGAVAGYYEGKLGGIEKQLLYTPAIAAGTWATISGGVSSYMSGAKYGQVALTAGFCGLAGATMVGTLSTFGYLTGKGLSYLF